MVAKHKLDQTFRGDDAVQEMEFAHRPMQSIFRDGGKCAFINLESYEQDSLPNALFERELPYLLDGMEGIELLASGDAVSGVELPGHGGDGNRGVRGR